MQRHVERALEGAQALFARMAQVGADIGFRQRHLAPAPRAIAAAIGVLRQRIGQRDDGTADAVLLRLVDQAQRAVVHRHFQAWQQHMVAVARKAVAAQVGMRMLDDGGGTAGQHAVIEALGFAHARCVGKQDGDRFERADMAAGHHQAQGQRRGNEQPGRAPHGAPEQRRDDHRQRRQAGTVAIHLRFDDIGDHHFQRGEQGHARQRQGPARIDGGHEHGDGQSGHQRAHIGHEAQQTAERTPQQGMRHLQQPQAQRDGQRKDDVDDELRKEKARHALGRMHQGAHGAADVALPRQAHRALAQRLVFQQDKHQQHEYQPGFADWP